MTDIFTHLTPPKFECKKCDFKCFKPSDWFRHLLTRKHKNTDILPKSTDNFTPKNAETLQCNCGKIYKHRQSLFNHKKKCIVINKTKMIMDVIKDDKNVHDFLMEQNKLLIEQLSQQNKQLMEQNTKLFEIAQTNNNNNSGTINNTINNHNKFNINVFLNETCKDAINLTDFVNQIQLSVSDLEETGKLGYAEGISKIFIKNLNDIDFSQRPIHCSDSKRDIFYIKDDNQWSKDNDSKDKLTNAIKIVANKNIKQIPEWQKANPDYMNPESKQNDKYMKMICEVMSGSTKEEQQKNYNKIIKNISKEVIIDKNNIIY